MPGFYRIGMIVVPQFPILPTTGQAYPYFFITGIVLCSVANPYPLHTIFLQYPPPIGKNPLGHPPSAFTGKEVKGEPENKVAVNIQAKSADFFILNRK